MELSKIAIVTDSTANLPRKWVEQYRVHVVPLKVHWGEETYRDGVDISVDEFYQRLAQSKELPTTSQPSVQDFLQVFENAAQSADAIIAPLISSGISGTVATAQLARSEFTRIPVEIVDTRITSMGQVLIILAIARALEQGKSLQEVKQIAEDIAQRLHVYFAVDTLEYLHRGGRINTASRYLGTVLAVKPILYFNQEEKSMLWSGCAPPGRHCSACSSWLKSMPLVSPCTLVSCMRTLRMWLGSSRQRWRAV